MTLFWQSIGHIIRKEGPELWYISDERETTQDPPVILVKTLQILPSF